MLAALSLAALSLLILHLLMWKAESAVSAVLAPR